MTKPNECEGNLECAFGDDTLSINGTRTLIGLSVELKANGRKALETHRLRDLDVLIQKLTQLRTFLMTEP